MQRAVLCPECQERLSYDDVHEHQLVRCKFCNAKFRLGGSRKRTKSKSDANLYALLGLGAAAAASIVGLIVYLTTHRARVGDPGGDPKKVAAAENPIDAAGGQPGVAPAAVAGKPAAAWPAKADPSSVSLDFVVAADIASPVEGELLFPSLPSRFVCVEYTDGATRCRELIDLQTGERRGRLEGYLKIFMSALSQSGRYIAGGSTEHQNSTVIVYDFTAGKQVAVLPIAAEKYLTKAIFFTPSDDLVTIQATFDRNLRRAMSQIKVWNVGSGKLKVTVPADDLLLQGAAALSPGGRMLLVNVDQALLLYDLAVGTLLATVPFHDKSSISKAQCRGVSFSANGQTFAALIERERNYKVIGWNCNTGSIAFQHDLDAAAHGAIQNADGSQRNAMQWLSDNSSVLLAGMVILDTQSGQVTWRDPESSEGSYLRSHHYLRLFGNDQFVGIEKGTGSKKNSLRVFSRSNLPKPSPDQIAKRSRPNQPADIPADPKSDLSNTPRIKIEPPGKWQALVDEPTERPKLPVRSIVLRDLPGNRGTVLLSPGAIPKAVVLSEIDPLKNRFTAPGNVADLPCKLDWFQLGIGKHLGSLEPPTGSILLDVSPDGELVLLMHGAANQTLEIWSLSEGKAIASWRPFANEQVSSKGKTRAVSRGRLVSFKSVSDARFVDRKHVLTLSCENGTLVQWSVPEVKPVWVFDQLCPDFSLSPSRKFAAAPANRSVLLLDGTSGKVMDELALPDWLDSQQFDRCQFRFDGKMLAATCSGRRQAVVVWDLETGEIASAFYLPEPSSQWRWAGPDHLVDNRGCVIDLARKAVVWRYSIPHANYRIEQQALDGRFWYVVGDSKGGGQTLASTLLPDPNALKQIKTVLTENPEPLLAPGDSLSIQLNLSGAPADVQKRTAERLAAHLQQMGYVVVPSHATVLKVEMTQTGSQPITYEMFGGPGGRQTTTVNVASHKIVSTLLLNKQVIWQYDSAHSTYAPHLIHFDPRQLESQPWQYIESAIEQFTFPKVLYPQPRSAEGRPWIGESQLGPTGASSQPIDPRQLGKPWATKKSTKTPRKK